MYDNKSVTIRRKKDHLELFRAAPVDSRWTTSLLECVQLIHCALPETALDEIDLSTTFAGHHFRAPFFITGITGGTPDAAEINRALARVADEFGIGFGLGSQRAMLQDDDLTATYAVREAAPTAFIAGNIGGVQATRYPVSEICRLADRIGASALCIHLNPAQEILQPEGDRSFKGILTAIEHLTQELDIPLIVKETGAGISRETALRLRDAGVRHLDVAGAGGTSWIGVEILRSHRDKDPQATAFWDWGIPTAAAVCETGGLGLEVIASGGIRTGIDAARALALGATLVGAASPVLRAYYAGGLEGARNYIGSLLHGLRAATLLTGCRASRELAGAPRFIRSPLKEWVAERREPHA